MKKQTPEKYAVDRKPKEYLKQGMVHCGVYTAKAILEAYGKGIHRDPRKYHVNFINKISGAMFRSQDLINVFQKYSLNLKAVCAKDCDDSRKLSILKKLLLKDTPIPVFVGNGYTYAHRMVSYSRVKALLVGHIISIWGYDDNENVFYLYDSAVSKEYYDKDIPIGNVKRTYQDFLRDWKGAFHRRWLVPYTYLEILD
ncbi:MAG: hypothetical protein Q8P72_06730 [Candidatus Roizmanbacteria bacterium]|nr:hypothetical protein [Candidatus Roizmanbacteria bacterium]